MNVPHIYLLAVHKTSDKSMSDRPTLKFFKVQHVWYGKQIATLNFIISK